LIDDKISTAIRGIGLIAVRGENDEAKRTAQDTLVSFLLKSTWNQRAWDISNKAKIQRISRLSEVAFLNLSGGMTRQSTADLLRQRAKSDYTAQAWAYIVVLQMNCPPAKTVYQTTRPGHEVHP
jgi:hypothetical protein